MVDGTIQSSRRSRTVVSKRVDGTTQSSSRPRTVVCTPLPLPWLTVRSNRPVGSVAPAPLPTTRPLAAARVCARLPGLVSIKALKRLCTRSIQALYTLYTGSIQALYRLYTGAVHALYRLYAGPIQALYSTFCMQLSPLFSIAL